MPEEKLSLGVIVFFALKELWGLFKNDKKESGKVMQEHTKATQENTLSIVRLQVQIEMLLKAVEALPELRKDLDNVGGIVREMRRSQ